MYRILLRQCPIDDVNKAPDTKRRQGIWERFQVSLIPLWFPLFQTVGQEDQPAICRFKTYGGKFRHSSGASVEPTDCMFATRTQPCIVESMHENWIFRGWNGWRSNDKCSCSVQSETLYYYASSSRSRINIWLVYCCPEVRRSEPFHSLSIWRHHGAGSCKIEIKVRREAWREGSACWLVSLVWLVTVILQHMDYIYIVICM